SAHAFDEETVSAEGLSFLTTPFIIVRILSVLNPVCTPPRYKGLLAAATCNLYEGLLTPIPTFPDPSMRILSLVDCMVPPVMNTRALDAVPVPIKKLLPVVY